MFRRKKKKERTYRRGRETLGRDKIGSIKDVEETSHATADLLLQILLFLFHNTNVVVVVVHIFFLLLLPAIPLLLLLLVVVVTLHHSSLAHSLPLFGSFKARPNH